MRAPVVTELAPIGPVLPIVDGITIPPGYNLLATSPHGSDYIIAAGERLLAVPASTADGYDKQSQTLLTSSPADHIGFVSTSASTPGFCIVSSRISAYSAVWLVEGPAKCHEGL